MMSLDDYYAHMPAQDGDCFNCGEKLIEIFKVGYPRIYRTLQM
jgi:hypothetical protein